MNLDDRLSRLVRDAVEPMLLQLEQRLVERIEDLDRPPILETAPELLTAKELASYLRISPRTVQRRVAAGELPSPIQVSRGRARWRRRDVDSQLDIRGAS